MCFFHIPKFREQFLSLISDLDDENYKGDIFQSPKRDRSVSSAILPIYNWQEYFYDKIPEVKQIDANKVFGQMKELSGEQDW